MLNVWMPAGTPIRFAPARMSASACLNASGEGGLPSALRMLAARSLGPTNTASTPGTEYTASKFRTASMCSHWRTIRISSFAFA